MSQEASLYRTEPVKLSRDRIHNSALRLNVNSIIIYIDGKPTMDKKPSLHDYLSYMLYGEAIEAYISQGCLNLSELDWNSNVNRQCLVIIRKLLHYPYSYDIAIDITNDDVT